MSDDRIPEVLRVEAARNLHLRRPPGVVSLPFSDVLSTALRPAGHLGAGLCAVVVPTPRGRGPASDDPGLRSPLPIGDHQLSPPRPSRAIAAVGEVELDPEMAKVVHRDAALSHLASLAAAGDGAALGRLLTSVRPTVVRYCRARLGSSGVGLHQAEDVAQNVLLAVCGAIPRYRSGETRVMSFVYGIASNKVVDAFRAAGRDHSEPTDTLPETADPAPGPESAAVLRAQIDQMWTLLALLSAPHREILVMRLALQFSAEETALALGSTAGAVRVTQHRALAKLRGLVAEDRRTTSPRFDL